MNIEIKFRGQDDLNNWHYGTYHYSNDKTYHYILNREKLIDIEPHFSCFHEKETHLVKMGTVGMFLGVKDVNDKEIYTGDIVDCEVLSHSRGSKTKTIRCEVVYSGQMFYPKPISSYNYGVSFDNCTIVGNIFDNPELVSELS